MKELKRQQAFDCTIMIWQPALNLMGLSENTSLIQGDALPNLEEFLETHKNHAPMLAVIRTMQARLFLIFGEHEMGAKLFIAHGFDWPAVAPAHPMTMESVFCGGVAAFEMAQTTKKRKYKLYAKKARAKIKDWVRKGNPNVRHHKALLDAEKDVLTGKPTSAEKNYQAAIAMASRGGYVHDAALANERYGNFMLSVLSDKDGAAFYLKKAIHLYSEWGASKKAKLLYEKHSTLLAKTTEERSPF